MFLLDLTLPDLAANLALDEAFLMQAEETGLELLRLWHWPNPAVVLGAGGKLTDDVNEAACRADGVPILRRGSGGGTVLLGRGCLIFSLVLAHERHPRLADLHSSYAYVLGWIGQALTPLAGEVRHEGISDLTLAARKFSGNAQHRKRRCVLHHGTILVSFDLAQCARYLKDPPRQPEYRAGRTHEEFLTNFPATAEAIKLCLAQTWNAAAGQIDVPNDLVERLVAEKFGRDDWVRRR